MQSIGDPAFERTWWDWKRRLNASRRMTQIIAARRIRKEGGHAELWSDKEKEILAFLKIEGLDDNEIARSLKRTPAAIRSRSNVANSTYKNRRRI